MTVQVTFKTPDAVYYASQDLDEDQKKRFKEVAEKWLKYGEYITVEFDLTTGNARVVPRR